jgi:uroporphyrinogen-III synthase
VRRLGLSRPPEDPLSQAVRGAGWEPVPLRLTEMVATGQPAPAADADAVLVLSPSAARLALLPSGLPCLAQGEATALALRTRGAGNVLTAAEPRAEGLLQLLRQAYPQGGSFLLARGERSREHLEAAAEGTPWRLLPWVTHREIPLQPPPPLPELEAVLALAPLQAELLGPRSQGLLRFAWGRRTLEAFSRAGYPVDGWCEPEVSALQKLLAARSQP